MEAMKVSIIVPVYNVKSYLLECVESVLCQSYKNYELVLVDDGSTDESGKICDDYSAKYPTIIKTHHIPNSGPLYARIYGMRFSSGDILLFLDSDDCLRTDALDIIVASCSQGCDMVLFNTETTEAFLSKAISYPYMAGQVFEGKTKNSLYQSLVSGAIPNSVCSKAIRKECAILPEYVEKFGKVRYGEDLLLSAHFITNCNKIVYLAEGLYHYRIRPGSAVHSFDIYRKESIKTVHTELEKYIEKWNIPELKPLHNARKVRGWIEDLKLLLKHRSTLSNGVFCDQLRSMATDPYFRNAYNGMDSSRLSRADRILAFCLMKKQYFLLRSASHVLNMRKK